jgi:hypothetical protein
MWPVLCFGEAETTALYTSCSIANLREPFLHCGHGVVEVLRSNRLITCSPDLLTDGSIKALLTQVDRCMDRYEETEHATRVVNVPYSCVGTDVAST